MYFLTCCGGDSNCSTSLSSQRGTWWPISALISRLHYQRKRSRSSSSETITTTYGTPQRRNSTAFIRGTRILQASASMGLCGSVTNAQEERLRLLLLRAAYLVPTLRQKWKKCCVVVCRSKNSEGYQLS